MCWYFYSDRFKAYGYQKTSTTKDIYAYFLLDQDNQASLAIGYALDQAFKSTKTAVATK